MPTSGHSSSPVHTPPTTHLPSSSMDFLVLETLNTWGHTIHGLLCLASVPWHNVSKVCPAYGMDQYFLPSMLE